MLKKIGVNVQVQAMDWSTLTSRRVEEESTLRGWLAPVSHLGDGRRRGLAGQQHRPVGRLRGESVVRLAVR